MKCIFGKIREVEEIGFWISREVAPHMILAHDVEYGCVPEEIQKIIDEGAFADKAKNGLLPNGYSESFVLADLYEDKDRVYYAMPFAGTISTLFPKRAVSPIRNCICARDDGPFFIPASRKADMFIPAYSSPDELLDGFKSVLAGFGVELPDDFDWFAHVVRIDGTEFYDE